MITNNQKLIIDQITSEFEKMNKQSKTTENKYSDMILKELNAYKAEMDIKKLDTKAFDVANQQLFSDFVEEVKDMIAPLGDGYEVKSILSQTNEYCNFIHDYKLRLSTPFGEYINIIAFTHNRRCENYKYFLEKSGLIFRLEGTESRDTKENILSKLAVEIIKLNKKHN